MRITLYVCLCLLTGTVIARGQQTGIPNPFAAMPDEVQRVNNVIKVNNGIGTLITATNPAVGAQITSATAALTTALGQWQADPADNGLTLATAIDGLWVTVATIQANVGANLATLIPIDIAGISDAWLYVPLGPYTIPHPASTPPVLFLPATIPHIGNNTPEQDFVAAWNAAAGGVTGAPTL